MCNVYVVYVCLLPHKQAHFSGLLIAQTGYMRPGDMALTSGTVIMYRPAPMR